nr:MAG TPA: hypothetical protein [Caudoviricetes sp.]
MQFVVKVKNKNMYIDERGYETSNICDAQFFNSFEDAKEMISNADDSQNNYSIVKIICRR